MAAKAVLPRSIPVSMAGSKVEVAEQAMLDLIPFRRAGRVMPDFDGEPHFVRELL